MKSALCRLLFFFLSVLFAFSATASAVENTQSIQERRVQVLITATDGSGNPTQALTADSISLTDNGVSAKILDVRKADGIPLRLGFVLLGGQQNFEQQQAAAVEIARKVLRPNIDRAFVLTAHKEKTVANLNLEWQNDPANMEKAIRSQDKNFGVADPFVFDVSFYSGTMNRMMSILTYGGEGGKSVFDVVWMMMKSDPTPARHVIVTFRDPWAHSPGTGAASPEYTQAIENNHRHLIADAQRSWTPFLIVGLEGQSGAAPGTLTRTYAPTLTGQGGADRERDEAIDRYMEAAHGTGRNNVQRLAEETGGRIWWSTKKNFPDAVNGIVNLLNSGFAVTYAVPVTPGGPAEHLLEVKTTAPNTRINVQKVYFSRVGPAAQQQPKEPAGTGGTHVTH